MLTLCGSSRNITGILVDDNDTLHGYVEVVLICSQPFYGMAKDNKLAKGTEIKDLRFCATPKSLRSLADRLNEFADECEDVFGVEATAEEVKAMPENLPAQHDAPSEVAV